MGNCPIRSLPRPIRRIVWVYHLVLLIQVFPKTLFSKLLLLKKIPVQKLQARKAKIENKQTLLNDLTTRVENLKGSILGSKTERSFRELTVDVDSDAISATVDKNLAEPGNYKVEVMQLAQKSSAISNGVEDPDETYLGVGYIQYELPNGEEKEVYIDAANSSLNGIAKLINKDPRQRHDRQLW
jgi:flagellar hook-associated protein 2